MRTKSVYQIIHANKNTVSKLYSGGVSYAQIARQLTIETGTIINRRRVGEYINDNLKSNDNIILKYTHGSDVAQIRKHYIKAVESVSKIKRPQVSPPRNKDSFNVLVLSDLHLGQLVKPSDVDGYNEYNEDIAVRRLGNILEQVAMLEDKRRLNVFLLGDLVHGDLPNKQDFILTQEYGLVRQTLRGFEILKDFFRDLLEIFEYVDVRSVSGNHGRLPNKSKMPNVQRDENFDWLISEFLIKAFDEEDRYTHHNTGMFNDIFNLNGVRFGITHGHGLRLYDAKTSLQNFNDLHSKDRNIDVLLHGHFHHITVAELPHHRFVIGNGSLVGADPYAFNDLMKASVPSQLLLNFNNLRDSSFSLDSINRLIVDY